MDEILKLREELERERMRLAACGVVALANTPDSAEKARTMHDDYRSASCDDVARAVDRQMALHNALTAVMSYPGVRDYLGRQVSEIADSALMGPNDSGERGRACATSARPRGSAANCTEKGTI